MFGDRRTLLPDAVEILHAAEGLVGDGFAVLAHITDDPVMGRRLEARTGLRGGHAPRLALGSGLGVRIPLR